MSQREVEQVYELSPMQQAMLFHSLVAPGSGVYVIQVSLLLRGPLDTAAFARSWRRMVARHDVLRTAFHWQDLEKPLQVVYRQAEPELLCESWRGLPPAEQRRRAADHLAADRARGFDLQAPPLLRLALRELDADLHQFVWTQHHLTIDGWSQGWLLRELFGCYAALASGREPALARPRPYRDYIAWLQRQELGEAERFWRRSLAGFRRPTLLAGGAQVPQAAADFRRAARREVRLGAELSAALRELGRCHRLTSNTLVQGAWALVLARASGERDVAFGATVSGRPAELAGVESIVGPFINTLPVRVKVTPERRLLPWLAELQERQAEGRRYEHAPLAQVQRWSELGGGVPLFDHLLVFENLPVPDELSDLLPGLAISQVEPSELTNYPLNLAVAPGADLGLVLEHDGGRFDGAAAARLLERLAALLAAFAAAPEQALGELPALLPGERHQLLVEWNDGRRQPPVTDGGGPGGAGSATPPVEELIAGQARRRPAAIAVVGRTGQLSYGELERRAARLARRLQRLGAGPAARVGLLLERSPDLVVAILAALRAGGAYVPLSPADPPARLGALLGEAAAAVVVTRPAWRARLPADVAVLELAPDEPDLPGEAAAAATPEETPAGTPARAEDLAYVLFTSGSTGRPKGVMVSRGAVADFTLRASRLYGLTAADRVLGFAAIEFDTSVEEILPCLASGATLVLRDEEMALSTAHFLRVVAAWGITVLDLPTAFWHQLAADLAAGGINLPGTLRLVILGGEAARREQVAQWRSRAGAAVRLVNSYGPTEATVVATACDLGPGSGDDRVPIGRPLPGREAYVLDPWLEPCPLGVAGELCLGGSLARGYLGAPALTAERFVPAAWSAAPGERLYRTGDRARYRPDGVIDFLGRADHQVKVRGFRVELGEIEAALAAHPGVGEAVALDTAPAGRPARLTAWWSPRGGAAVPAAGDLQAWLRARLPAYMVPAGLVGLAALPRTRTGKVDRRALAGAAPLAAAGAAALADAAGQPPRTPLEEIVAGIWADVLGLPRVGALDNFFELGGHSLLATQVTSRLRRAFGVELPLRALFEAPTVAALAALVARALAEARGKQLPAPPLVPAGQTVRPRLSFAQERLWFLAQLDPRSVVYNVPSAVRLLGRLDAVSLARALTEIVRRHAVLRTRFVVEDGQPVARAEPAAPVGLPLADLAGLPLARRRPEAESLAAREQARPFDLAAGPPLRALLLRLDEREHLAALTVHHVATDLWSEGILLRELAVLYGDESFRAGGRSPLGELPVQYADYAAWQRLRLSGEALAEHLAYWRRLLAEAPPALELPADRPRQGPSDTRAALACERLGAAATERLAGLCRRQGATLFMALLAAFAAVVGRAAGQDRVAVATPIAGRTREELEQLIGCFVNTLVLPADLGGDPDFEQLLERVREVALGAYAHQDLPFERLVAELEPLRDLARSPLAQVMLAWQNAPPVGERLAALELVPVARPPLQLDLDLLLAAGEREGVIELALAYRAALFDRASIRLLLERLTRLLAAAAADPAARLSTLLDLGPVERQQLLVEWNDTRAEVPPGGSLHGLVEAQVAGSPRSLAAVVGEQVLTYGELDAWASGLARRLRSLGTGRGSVVGVHLDRCLELPATLLGVLKAGAAWLPLAPDDPLERLARMVADSGARVVVTGGDGGQVPGWGAGVAVVDWRQEGEGLRRGPGAPGVRVDPAELAYVIYTSGSTGRPKGVMTSHGAICNRLLWMAARHRLDAAERVLQKTPVSFDVSVWELFTPLLAGGRLVLARPGGHRDNAYLLQLIAGQGVTTAHFVPSMLAAFVEEPGEARCPTLARVVASGEALPYELTERFFARWGEVELHNLYGPTEAAVEVSAWACAPDPARRLVPIGRAIANVRLYVVDAGGRPLPVGAAGELWIGGAAVARGYLGRPELTAERFVPDPFAPRAGARAYRTGDRVRWLGDGTVDFLGRLDHQVKLRGFRIEPGEVEAALGAHPAVLRCAVAVRERAGDRRLVAWVVGREPDPPAAEELRRWLLQRLPEPMVPTVWVRLPALPLTPSGKVDRKALAASALREEPAGGAAWQAPRTPVEAAVAGIWAEVLGLPRVGAADDFFALGGHSLLAARLMARLRAAFQVELPLRGLFEAPTVAGLAALVERALAARDRPAGATANPATPELAPAAPAMALDDRLRAAAALAPEIRPPATAISAAAPAAPREVLLTGATGFLGAWLVRELLRQTGARVHCLVRAAAPEAAARKLGAALAPLALDPDELAARVVPLPGDLGGPLLGLPPARFERLAQELELIVHNGAAVDFLADYPALEAINVGGTREVLRLACAGRLKPVCHLSTIDVLFSDEHAAAGAVAEDDPLGDCQGLDGGYPQSKWVAERLVAAACRRGLPVTVIRPGLIAGDSRSGRGNVKDFATRLVGAILRLRAFPRGAAALDLVPVDFAAAAIVWLACRGELRGRCFHLVNPRPMPPAEVLAWLRSSGYELEEVSAEGFRLALVAHLEGDADDPLAPFLPMLKEIPAPAEAAGGAPPPPRVRPDCRQTFAALASSGLVCPPVDGALLAIYFSHLVRAGLLPPPGGSPAPAAGHSLRSATSGSTRVALRPGR
jgi:amino acid adenylation domain-containing protein/thioester reductase-like protein